MNTLHLSPVGAKTAPPGLAGGSPPSAAEGLVTSKSTPNPRFAKSLGPDAAQQLADARASTLQAATDRKARVDTAVEDAKEAKKAREARDAAAKEKAPVKIDLGTLDRKVGLVEGTTKVFVDLVDTAQKRPVARVFGPSEAAVEPPPAPKTPAGVTNAYTRAATAQPLKDVGVA